MNDNCEETIQVGEKVTEEGLPAILAGCKNLKAAFISTDSTNLTGANAQSSDGR